jgi:glycosyltransferase involved in cell wall biosynthesis
MCASHPIISVIIPAYNHALYIRSAVESVLAQTYPAIELIIIDDGSSDETWSILQRFSAPNIRLLQQPNQGASATINRGLQLAQGQYLAILNSDDTYHPERLKQAFDWLQQHPSAALVGSAIEIINASGQSIGIKDAYRSCPPWPLAQPAYSFRAGDELQAALLTENYWATTSNFVFPRWVWAAIGEFQPLRFTHDWDFALRASLLGELGYLSKPLLQYRVHDSNTIRTNRVEMVFEILWCLAVHLPKQVRQGWFGAQPLAVRTNQLLHSIYTFGNDTVLNTLLLLDLATQSERALQLLDPANTVRHSLLAYIEAGQREQQPAVTATSWWRALWHRLF